MTDYPAQGTPMAVRDHPARNFPDPKVTLRDRMYAQGAQRETADIAMSSMQDEPSTGTATGDINSAMFKLRQ